MCEGGATARIELGPANVESAEETEDGGVELLLTEQGEERLKNVLAMEEEA